MTHARFVVGDLNSSKFQLNFDEGVIVAKNSAHELCTMSISSWGMPVQDAAELLRTFETALRIAQAINTFNTATALGDALQVYQVTTSPYRKENGA